MTLAPELAAPTFLLKSVSAHRQPKLEATGGIRCPTRPSYPFEARSGPNAKPNKTLLAKGSAASMAETPARNMAAQGTLKAVKRPKRQRRRHRCVQRRRLSPSLWAQHRLSPGRRPRDGEALERDVQRRMLLQPRRAARCLVPGLSCDAAATLPRKWAHPQERIRSSARLARMSPTRTM